MADPRKRLGDVRADHVRRYEFAINTLARHGAQRVLDAACGIAYGSKMLADAGFQTAGIDIASAEIAHGLRYFASAADLSVGDILTADLPKFDAVVSFETIEHIEDDAALLRKFAGLAPLLIASVPNQDGHPFDPKRHPDHVRHYRLQEFEDLLTGAGYTIREWLSQTNKKGDLKVGRNVCMTMVVVAEQ